MAVKAKNFFDKVRLEFSLNSSDIAVDNKRKSPYIPLADLWKVAVADTFFPPEKIGQADKYLAGAAASDTAGSALLNPMSYGFFAARLLRGFVNWAVDRLVWATSKESNSSEDVKLMHPGLTTPTWACVLKTALMWFPIPIRPAEIIAYGIAKIGDAVVN